MVLHVITPCLSHKKNSTTTSVQKFVIVTSSNHLRLLLSLTSVREYLSGGVICLNAAVLGFDSLAKLGELGGSRYKWGEMTPINGRKYMGFTGVISPHL